MKRYVCRRLRLYNYLSQHGFRPELEQADKYDAKRLIWIYSATDELQKAIDAYYTEAKAGGKHGENSGT